MSGWGQNDPENARYRAPNKAQVSANTGIGAAPKSSVSHSIATSIENRSMSIPSESLRLKHAHNPVNETEEINGTSEFV
jgi:hypothetical protein